MIVIFSKKSSDYLYDCRQWCCFLFLKRGVNSLCLNSISKSFFLSSWRFYCWSLAARSSALCWQNKGSIYGQNGFSWNKIVYWVLPTQFSNLKISLAKLEYFTISQMKFQFFIKWEQRNRFKYQTHFSCIKTIRNLLFQSQKGFLYVKTQYIDNLFI